MFTGRYEPSVYIHKCQCSDCQFGTPLVPRDCTGNTGPTLPAQHHCRGSCTSVTAHWLRRAVNHIPNWCHLQTEMQWDTSPHPIKYQHSKTRRPWNLFILLVYITTITSHCRSLRMDNELTTLLTTEPSLPACHWQALYHLPHFCGKFKQRNHQRWWKECIAEVSCGHSTAICLNGLRKLAKSRPRCEASTSGTHVCNSLLGYFQNTNYLPTPRACTVALGWTVRPCITVHIARTTNSRSFRTHKSVCNGQSLDSSVSTVTCLRAEHPKNRTSIPGMDNRFLSPTNWGSSGHPFSCYRGPFARR